jgi:hypothetical protein
MKHCEEIKAEIPLYCYGEICAEREEAIEQHVAQCAECRAELDKHHKFLDVLDNRDDDIDSCLLTTCRADLHTALGVPKKQSFWAHSFWNWHVPAPIAAAALIALGFFAGTFGSQLLPDPSQAVFSSVASIEPDASGQIRIAVDEVRRHMVSGKVEDPRIQSLLLNAVREESNPGVRAESVTVLRRNADSEQVQGALIDRLANDPDPRVRLNALEGLQSVSLRTIHRDNSIVGVLQDAVRKEDNTDIRLRCGRLLEEMKASVGTY